METLGSTGSVHVNYISIVWNKTQLLGSHCRPKTQITSHWVIVNAWDEVSVVGDIDMRPAGVIDIWSI